MSLLSKRLPSWAGGKRDGPRVLGYEDGSPSQVLLLLPEALVNQLPLMCTCMCSHVHTCILWHPSQSCTPTKPPSNRVNHLMIKMIS